MAEAAQLDRGYAVRAAHVGEEDGRRLSVGRTVARLVVKPLVAAGCAIEPPGKVLGITSVRQGRSAQDVLF